MFALVVFVADRAEAERWSRVGGRAANEEAGMAVAWHPASGRTAVGDADGVSVWDGQQRHRFSMSGVRDVEFDERGLLWIGTELGLFRWAPDDDSGKGGRPRRLPLTAGEIANRILRLDASAAGVFVATEAGTFWSESGDGFSPLSIGGSRTRVDFSVGVRLKASSPGLPGDGTNRPRPERIRVWALSRGDLHVVTGLPTKNGIRIFERKRIEGPRPLTDRVPRDLRIGPNGERLILLFDDELAWRWIDERSAARPDVGWRIERPVLPPGATARRMAWGAGRFWLATDHGLMSSRHVGGTFERAGHPVGTSGCSDVDGGGLINAKSGMIALCGRGVFAYRASEAVTDRRAERGLTNSVAAVRSPDRQKPVQAPLPPLAALRERALDLAGLSMSRSVALRRGLARRAFWPDLTLRFDADVDRDREWDEDQAFISGDTRQLFDRRRDRTTGLSGFIELEWELGGVAYPEDSVDLSRELRQVVSLRDDISDEINQLYFARLKLQDQLAAGVLGGPESRRDLQLRADELDAGLDAWTGGWLSVWRLEQANGRAVGSE